MIVKVIAGLIIVVLGLANLRRSRREPPVINARMLMLLGHLGTLIGSVLALAGLLEWYQLLKK